MGAALEGLPMFTNDLAAAYYFFLVAAAAVAAAASTRSGYGPTGAARLFLEADKLSASELAFAASVLHTGRHASTAYHVFAYYADDDAAGFAARKAAALEEARARFAASARRAA